MQDQLSENAEEVCEDESSTLFTHDNRGGTRSKLLPATVCQMCPSINAASNNAAAEVESCDGCYQKLISTNNFETHKINTY